jgi:5-oxoprolinase (ATP-hydrolysing) subunit C
MSLEVLEPGWASRIVDAGRPDCRSLGVPLGGAADRTALALGNALVGNPPDAPALEVCLRGPHLRATTDIACVLYGAPFELDGPRRDLRPGKTFTLRAGDEIHMGGTPEGMRAYLCVCGGFEVAAILGSRSALDVIHRGESLPCRAAALPAHYARNIAPDFADHYALRMLPGLQAGWFHADEFFRQEFTVGTASNRMGLRLEGKPLTMPERELISEPVAPGAIQVTRDGQCIILGVDGQTIGGYPKIAHVIAADLDRLGQLRPGDRIRFVPVTPAEAVTLYREQLARLRSCVLRWRAADTSSLRPSAPPR